MIIKPSPKALLGYIVLVVDCYYLRNIFQGIKLCGYSF